MGDMTSEGANVGAGIDLSQFYQVFFEEAGENLDRTLTAQALVRENDRDHVFVRTGNQRFLLTPVELGPAQDNVRPVLKGLKEGDEVVTDGAFHMNNERKRAELE